MKNLFLTRRVNSCQIDLGLSFLLQIQCTIVTPSNICSNTLLRNLMVKFNLPIFMRMKMLVLQKHLDLLPNQVYSISLRTARHTHMAPSNKSTKTISSNLSKKAIKKAQDSRLQKEAEVLDGAKQTH